ncbi:aspartate--tRNA(Asn) ligase [Deinococcus lacus]|uniref:Aspartate--tRNA ligase n=1 Tax=Deinococcus lacus TaxID=392561 RepID=A0ABW1YA74_9DEIO
MSISSSSPALPRTLIRNLPQFEGQRVRLLGTLHTRRNLGGLQFLVLRDRSGTVQAVEQHLDLPSPESSLELWGTVVRAPKGGLEIQVEGLNTLSSAQTTPLEIPKLALVHQATALDWRGLTVRGLRERAILKILAAVLRGFRAALDAEDFTEISTPKLVSAGAEGGANLFALDYFGQAAYLAQSPQLYKQMMLGAFERVYEVGPVFRAEPHATSRHLNEYLSLDAELAYISSEEDVMELETRVLGRIVQEVSGCAAELDLLEAKLPEVPAQIPRITVADALELLRREYGYTQAGPDPDHEAERLLGEHFARAGSEWVFLTRFPASARPFYTYPEGEETRGFDLLFRGTEITSGGQRIHDYEQLRAATERSGLEASLQDYTEIFRYGMPPHGGFAIGAERLTALLLGLGNIRLARAFPRDCHRLTP